MAKIRGTNGNDFLRGTNGSDEIDGEGGDDLIFGRNGNDIIRGGAGNDIIFTGRGDNTVDGGTGDDIIIGDRGDDTIDGGDGDDIIIAGRGDDTVDGGAGDDIIIGDRGNDTLSGGAGNDIIDGGRGSDTMDGGDGSDTYLVGGRRDGFDSINDTGSGAGDYDVIEATSDNTRIQMRDFDSSNGIEEISGNGFANVDIRGDNGDNTFDFSNTTLSGIREIDTRGGNDSITGSAGDDNIDGGRGFDTVFYSGSIDDYDIQRSGSTTTVIGDGTDTLNRVEMLQFSDYTLFIDGRNNAPVAGDDAVSADEDTGATIAIADLIANDKDYDGDPLSFDSIDTSGTLGTVTVNPDGTLSYDSNGAYESLAVGETATDSFIYTISDGQGGFATGTVTVTVNGANDGPTAADDVGAVDETGVYYVPANGVLSNDSDPDTSDTLSVGAVEGDTANVGQQITLDSGAILTMRADGSYDYDPNGAFDYLASGETATDSFTYTVTDGHGVAGAPAEPVQRTLIDENFDGGAGAFTYADDTFRGTGEPAYADGASGAGFGDGGSGGLQVTLGGQDNADILGMSGGWSTTIDVPEDASGTLTFKYNLSLAENYEADEFAQVMLSVDGSPVGANGADHIAQLTGDGNGGPVMTTGWQTVTIDLGQLSAGSHTITIGGYSNKKTFNDESAEILIDDVQLTTDSTPMIETSLIDEGFDGGAGGFAYVDDAFRGTSEADYADGAWGAGFGETGGGLQITLGGQDGADIFGMSGGWQTTINVPEDASGTLTFKYNMTLAPNFESDEFGQVMVSIDGTLYGAGGNDYVTQLNGDGNGGAPTTTGWQTFTVNLADLPAGDHTLVIGGYSNKKTFADESIEILIDDVQFTTTTPDPDTNGPETATVTVTITGTNDDPVAADDVGSIDEDGVLSVAADGVLANDTDVNGDQLSVGAVEGDALNVGNPVTLGSGAIVTMNADGSYSYDTNSAFDSLMVGESTTDSFQYTVDDGQGGTDTATVTITINGANDAPIAIDDTVTVDEGVMVSVNGVLDNDIDPDPVDTLTVTEINGDGAGVGAQITLPSGALLTMNADGTYQYDPNGAFNSLGEGETGTDSFAYTVVDSNGATDTATVTVTINGANDAPTAVDDAATVGEDDILAVTSNGVLTNDIDPDTNDVLSVTEVNGSAVDGVTGLVQVTLASGAIVTMNADGTYNYNTNGSFESLAVGESTTDSFSYTMSDGNGGTDTATVTLTIQGANDAPDAVDDAATVGEGGVLFTTAANGLLANDLDIDNGSSFTVTEVAGAVTVAIPPGGAAPVPLASGAALAINADGSYTYFPFGAFDYLNAGETATDTFTYTITDEHGATDTATMTITITGVGAPPNQAPTATDDTGSVGEDGTLSVAANGVLSNDSDPDGDALTVSEVEGASGNVGTQITLGSGALLTMNADGSYDYDPNGVFDALNDGETATDSFTYTVDDGNGGTDTATVTITVNGATDNSAPIAVNDTLTVDEGVMVSVNGLLDNDVDPDPGDTLTVTHINGDSGNVGAQITLPSGALLTMNSDGTYTYDPNGAFNSLALGETTTDSFTYTATDSFGATDTATLTITINGANDAPVAADDAGSVGEDGVLAVAADGVLANDVDPDASDVLNVSAVEGAAANVGAAVTLASGAVVTMNADGSYSYDTNGAFNGLGAGESTTDSFTYSVDDGNGGTDTATVTVTINGANDGPTATDDSGSVGEEGLLSVAADGVLSNDSDPDGDALNVSAVEGVAGNVGTQITLASGALLTMNADGSYSYDPNGQFDALNDGETATDTFTYTVSDGNGGTDTATVTVTVNGSTDNTAPIAADDAGSVGEDGTLVVAANGVLSNDSDPDPGDTLTVTHVNGNSGNVGAQIALPSGALLTMNADGSYSYDTNGAFNSLSLGQTATDSFTYTATDSAGATDTATLTITVNGANDAPVAADDAGSVAEDGTLVVAANGVLSNDSDPDATDVLNVSAVEGAAANVGAAVTLASGAIVTMNADGSYSYDTNGAFNGLAAGESTTDTFTYEVSDGNGGVDTATVTVTVNGANDGPTAADDAGSVAEDGTLVVAANGVLSNDSDPDGDALNVSAVEGVAANVGAAVTLASGAIVTMNADGSYSYDTNGAFNGLAAGESTTDTFTYEVSDGNGGVDTATVTVTVNGANDGPTAADDAGSVAEDGTLVVAANGVLSNDSDPDATDVLNVSAVEGAAANVGAAVTLASGAIVTMNADGSYSYDTNGAFNGLAAGESTTDTFTYEVSDGNGGVDTATVTVTVNGANDGPTAADDAGSVAEDGTLVVAANGVLSNDSDPDATDVLNVSAVEGAAANVGAAVTLASGAIVTMNADGSYSYDTNGAFNGLAAGESTTDTFTYEVSDGNGGVDTATVTVTVNGANDGPTAGDDAGSVAEDGTLVVAANGVLSNDSDPDASDVLSVSAVEGAAANVGAAVTLASGAIVTMNADGSYSYDTNGAFNGLAAGESTTDTFTYTVDDGNGGTDIATVTITVNGANDGPTAADDAGSVGEDDILTVAANGVLSNDSDPDASDVLSVSAVEGAAANVGAAVTLASGAVVTMNADGSYSYDTNGAFNGLAAGESTTDSFTYTVDDGNGGVDTATVTVTVNGANDGPTAGDDAGSVAEDGTLVVAANGVLSNDSDPDASDVLSVSAVEGAAANVGAAVTLASGAIVTMNADGSYNYDTNGAFNGLAAGESTTDTFTYTVDDGNGGTDIATVMVTINGANDGPTAADDAGSVAEDGTLVVAANGVLSNDSDPDASDVLSVSAVEGAAANVGAAVTLASGAIVTMNADGSYSYDTNGAFNGLAAGESTTDTFTYEVSDGNGGVDTATVTVTVNGTNDGPTAGDDAGSVGEDDILTVAANGVLSNDSDPDASDVLSVSAVEGAAANVGAAVTLASGAIVTMNADGSYSYDTNGAFNGLAAGESTTDTFTYEVSDGNGGVDTATVTVTINGANDGPTAGDDTGAVGEDDVLTVAANGVLANDADPDNGSVLSVSAVEGAAANVGAAVTLASGAIVTMNADGSYSYDTNGAFNGLAAGESTTDTFTYEVSDGNGGVDTATVTVTVNGANDGPTAAADAGVVAEDDVLTVAANGVLANDVDPDATDVLAVSAVQGSAVNVGAAVTLASGAIVTMNADGSYSYDTNGVFNSLATGQTAIDSFTYTVDDGNGGTDTATVTVTINGANDGPIAGDDTGAVGEDGVLTVAANGVLANDSDPDTGSVLSVSAVEGAAANVGAATTLASGAVVTMNADGSYSYDPSGAFNSLAVGETGTDTFTYTVSDGAGGTDIATVTITITGANDAPVANDDALSVSEDGALNVAANGILSNDTDPDASDVLTVSAVQGSAANVGAPLVLASGALLTMNADGSYSYDPNGQFNDLGVGQTATDTFTYSVDDGNGGTDTATVTVTINGANDGPTAADDTGLTDENTVLTVPANGVLSNDSDPDAGDTFSVTAVQGSTSAVGGQIALASGALLTMNADGSYSYDPNGQYQSLLDGETATDSFTYTITDSQGATDTATVTVTINGISNSAPIAVDDAVATTEDDILAVAADGVLANDTDPDSGDVLSVSAVQGSAANVGSQITLASGALLTMNADGSYSYDPNGAFEQLAVGQTGTDTFTYTVDDGNGSTDTATVTVTVNGVNDAPVAVADRFVVRHDDNTEVESPTFLDNDFDPEGSTLTLISIDGTPVDFSAGQMDIFLGDPADPNSNIVSFNGDLSFTYVVRDPAAGDLLFGESMTTGPISYVIEDADGVQTTGSMTFVIANSTFSIQDIDGSNGFVVNGVASQDLAGHSVSGLGDVNGDGYDDFIVGSPYADPTGRADAGNSYVVYGSANGPLGGSLDLSSLDGSNGFTINGAVASQFTGFSVSGAGDINGDGFADILVGAKDNTDDDDIGVAGSKTAYVVYGGNSGIDTVDLSALGANGFSITGIDTNFSDIVVGSAGDVNGDGIADIVIGSQGAGPSGTGVPPTAFNIGESYVVFGQSTGFGSSIDVSTLDGTNGFKVTGDTALDNLGTAVSAGDLNNDGYDDIVVSAVGSDPGGVNNAGEVYVVYGGASGLPANVDVSTLNGTNGFTITGAFADGEAGNSVSAAGDINGDGIDDLVIGEHSFYYDTGGAYVVFGQDGGLGTNVDLASLDGTNGFRIVGNAQGDQAGYSVSMAGDINGDGFDDIIIGARGAYGYGYYGGYANHGESYVVFGSASGFGATLDLNQLDGSNGFTIGGVMEDSTFGNSVSSAGDVNGDGYDDLIVGAPKADANGNDSGASYILYGQDFQGNVTHQGTSAADTLTGDAGANTMIGGQGNDFLFGAGGADVLYGGEGDDTLAIADLAPQRIDGGTGTDTLEIQGASLAIDLGDLPISGIEAVDITGTGDNVLTLNVMDVLDASDSTNTLKVLGDLGDQVVAEGGWTSAGQQVDGGVTFDVYTAGEATLMVDSDLNNNVLIV